MKKTTMNLQISKWGNSLAVRIPAEIARSMDVKEGDSLEARLTVGGGLSLQAAACDRKSMARELEAIHASMSMGESVIDELRRGGRY